MKCENCNEECTVIRIEEPFLDDAYGCTMLFKDIFLYSECCGAEVAEDDDAQ